MRRPGNWLCYTRLVMTSVAIILVTISTFVHAFWNLLSKRQNPSMSFFFIASGFAAMCFIPLLIAYRATFVSLPKQLWLWIGLTSLFEAVYYLGLSGAYRHGDLSVAYPLLRAMPVILVAILTAVFSLGKPLNSLGVTGILFVAVGCLLLPLRSLRQVRTDPSMIACILLAGLAALGTTGYTLVDNQALFVLRSTPGIGLSRIEIAFFYLGISSFTITLAMGLYILFSTSERNELNKTWQVDKRTAFLTGALIVGTYGLVLAAMEYAENVSYIAAFRQLSIPLGALLGILVQREPAYPIKITSIGIIFCGLVLIMLA